ncbi:MAG: cyclophilin-like fold protein [Candidatus Omnitrophica bacterium]|nr:cyclophilin-like fold protein [Candidatus Omnitrophota bacterium]
MKNIVIHIGDLEIRAKLNGSQTAGLIWDSLPIKSFTSLWGEEIYFQIPVKCDLEEGFSSEAAEIGDLGYWPEGDCFCIFFGPTPISKPGEIRPASNVNIVGKIEADWQVLKSVGENETVLIEEDGQ